MMGTLQSNFEVPERHTLIAIQQCIVQRTLKVHMFQLSCDPKGFSLMLATSSIKPAATHFIFLFLIMIRLATLNIHSEVVFYCQICKLCPCGCSVSNHNLGMSLLR